MKGSRLDEVASLAIKNVVFSPGELSSRQGTDELPMVAADAQAAASLKPERPVAAKLTLKDGRVLPLTASIDAPRPRVTLIGKSVQLAPGSGDGNIQLSDPGEVPQDATLVFSIRTQSPAAFVHDESVEVATADESSTAVLSASGGGLSLENAQVAVATLSPAKTFGPSAFGPIKFRVLSRAVPSDWQPLANLVRLPVLRALECPSTPETACKLSGSSLYLIDSVSGNSQFADAVQVPEGFLGQALPVPHPSAGALYIKLRDNPQIINPIRLTAQELPAPALDPERAQARRSAHVDPNQGSAHGENQPPPPP